MKSGKGICILNPYDFLPSYGETSIKLVSQKSNLAIVIRYDLDPEGEGEETMSFDGVVSLLTNTVPGVSMGSTEYQNLGDMIFCLVEFPNSDLLKSWQAIRQENKFRHFAIFFKSAGLRVELVARQFELLKR